MICAWNELLAILPPWLASEVDKLGKESMEELRLRIGQSPELVLRGRQIRLPRIADRDDITFVVNTASRYSPWSAATVSQGYITSKGGHRIGLSGEAVIKNGVMEGLRTVQSLCIRVARDFSGIGKSAADRKGSILLIGPPGSGKTTLLRDIVRYISKTEQICVVDERGELFPEGMGRGQRMDVLTGCPKASGMEMMLRTMGPEAIAVDEITSEEDCAALIKAAWCGVRLLATAHAESAADLRRRSIYKPLVEACLFDHILVLDRNKLWKEEKRA